MRQDITNQLSISLSPYRSINPMMIGYDFVHFHNHNYFMARDISNVDRVRNFILCGYTRGIYTKVQCRVRPRYALSLPLFCVKLYVVIVYYNASIIWHMLKLTKLLH